MFKVTYLMLFCVRIHEMIASERSRVCIIGAGIAGLTSSRYLKEEGINYTVFETTKYIGGTWRYEEKVGTDEYNMPIHTSMYKNLRTNLPKPVMELHGFPIPEEYPSFPSWKKYYEYIQSYARHFDLEKHIKFQHDVKSIRRVGDVWKVTHTHIPSNEEFENEFDFIIVGTGHHLKAKYPTIPNENLFKGTIIHSHDYRVPEPYKGRRVLIVGAGPSGMDISMDVAEVSQTLVHSHHSKIFFRTVRPPNYIKKPDIKEFNETGAIFQDGTFEELDDVIYCTGFKYYFPFLDESSGLNISPNAVTPLYRYMVNINQPSMVFLGLIVRACLVVALDAQARYATALIKGNFTLPSQSEMMAQWQRQADVLRSNGKPFSYIHILAEKEDNYYADLTKESGIERVAPVMFKIRTLDTEAKIQSLYTYRNYAYTVIDRDNFVRYRIKND